MLSRTKRFLQPTKWFSKKILAKESASFFTSHWLYGRCLGLITLLAFLSYWWQGDCLIGENGLSPWKTDLQRIEKWDGQNPKSSKWSIRPTLLWLKPFASHHLLFSLGSISALLLTIGFFPTICGITSYLCY